MMLTIPGAAPKNLSGKRAYDREASRNDPLVEFDDMPDRYVA